MVLEYSIFVGLEEMVLEYHICTAISKIYLFDYVITTYREILTMVIRIWLKGFFGVIIKSLHIHILGLNSICIKNMLVYTTQCILKFQLSI